MLRALLKLFSRRRTTAPPAPAATQAGSIFDLVGARPDVREKAVHVPPPAERRVLDISNRFSSTEHYYHFMLGFLTPLVLGPVLQNPATVYTIRSCGPMDVHIHALALPNIEIIEKTRWRDLLKSVGKSVERIYGFDDPAFYDPAAFARLRAIMLDRLRVDASAQEDGVLFIARGESPAFYQSEESDVKTSANLRRTVPNLPDIVCGLGARGVVSKIAELETMPLREQVALFASARILVAQHGAALANMLWMPPGCAIIEINPIPAGARFRDYFRDLATACGHRYAVIEQVSPHAPVEAAEITAALSALGLFEGLLAPPV
jgi:hypothetical protein